MRKISRLYRRMLVGFFLGNTTYSLMVTCWGDALVCFGLFALVTVIVAVCE